MLDWCIRIYKCWCVVCTGLVCCMDWTGVLYVLDWCVVCAGLVCCMYWTGVLYVLDWCVVCAELVCCMDWTGVLYVLDWCVECTGLVCYKYVIHTHGLIYSLCLAGADSGNEHVGSSDPSASPSTIPSTGR